MINQEIANRAEVASLAGENRHAITGNDQPADWDRARRRYNVLVLPPILALTLVLAVGTRLAGGGPTMWTALVIMVGLQFGYLIGSAINQMLVVLPKPHDAVAEPIDRRSEREA